MVKQISDNEIYLLIKYIKSVLWRVAKSLSYIEDARCLNVKAILLNYMFRKLHVLKVPWKQVFLLLSPDFSSLGFCYKCSVLERDYKQFYF